jgi:spoIIIJ-associated protein
MAPERDFQGRTLEEALERAAVATGMRGSDLAYQVVDGGRRGLIGVGGRPVRIRVVLPEVRQGEGEEEPAVAADPAEVERLAERILGGLGLEVRSRAQDAGETIELDLTGEDRDSLLARRGQALSALQYLLNRIIYRGRRGKKIHVDAGGFRKLREDEVVEIARRSAEKVLAKGEEFVLSPLNPYERRLVHLALRDVPGVETKSLGNGFLKRVAIYPVRKGDPGGSHGGA